LWSLSTSLKKFLSSVLSVLTICWMAEAIMPDFYG
jgi:homoserine trans-succinylase